MGLESPTGQGEEGSVTQCREQVQEEVSSAPSSPEVVWDGKRTHYRVHWLQPRLWGETVPSLTSWRPFWDHPIFRQTHGVWAS